MNVEALIVEHLNQGGFKAYADVPANRPAEFVTVERTGGASDALDRPTVAVQSWASTRYAASELAIKVDACMKGIVMNTDVAKVSRNTLYNYPDESGHPRYQAVYDLVTY